MRAGEAEEALHEGDVAQRCERVHDLEQKDLGDQVVLILCILEGKRNEDSRTIYTMKSQYSQVTLV